MIDFEGRHELSRNELFLLQRTKRRADRSSVLLKIPRNSTAPDIALPLLEHEFEILREISTPGVPRALEFLGDGDGLGIVLEDLGGEPLRTATVRGDIERLLLVGIHLCTILDHLHGRDVVHCHISPDSIFVRDDSGEVQLIDFSRASPFGRGVYASGSQNIPAEFLPYCSPEQTGRVNRDPDYRTDFYSLGVTLYELLLGAPPFRSVDPMELIHWHIAKQPVAPRDVDSAVPAVLSDLIVKLLAKRPDDRYQTAYGLKQDLETCLRQWKERREISPFQLGKKDIPDRFQVPQRLYGREPEVRQLSRVFDATCDGQTSLVLVAGYAGIGKTALVEDLYRPMVRQRGYFISGKFDQVARDIPFGALIQAFRGLVRQLLTETETRQHKWRNDLNSALGSNAGVLTEVIPELEWIVGEQSPPPVLGPAETQNRFQLVFHDLLQTLARSDHPLIVFLDDLQWADSATLRLLEPLLTSADIRHLLILGAYRDNEVDSGHALSRTVRRIESQGTRVHRVVLRPLAVEDVGCLVGDMLRRGREEVDTLARLVVKKTEGNPFFMIQFMKSLCEEKLIEFNRERGYWDFRMEAIAAAPMMENVSDLMTSEIRRSSEETAHMLSLAACIGNEFDLEILALITDQTVREVTQKLSGPLRQGLLLQAPSQQVPGRTSRGNADEQGVARYRFLHDRVQQAAYLLIPEASRAQAHLRLGRLLLKSWGPNSEEKLFDIVQHLNLGRVLVSEEDERMGLVKLNVSAGRKAKSSAAYDAALGYFRVALDLVAGRGWDTHHDLLFALHVEVAECTYLCGDFEDAERRFELLLEHAEADVDKASVLHLRLVLYENRSRYPDAVRCGRDGLALLGVMFPDAEPRIQAALEDEIAAIEILLNGREVESLVDLPMMVDAEKCVVMKLLTSIWAPAYITGNPVLARLISATIVRLSLEHGITEESAYGYVTHAITVGPIREEYQAAYEWGNLALRTDERFANSKQRAKIHQQFHAHVVLWRRPFAEAIPHAQEACRVGLETGDLNYAAYGAFTESWASFLTARELGRFVQEQSPNLDLLRKMKMTDPLGALTVIVSWAQALRGQTASVLSLSSGDFDEEAYAKTYHDRPFFLTPYWAMKVALCLTFESYEEALVAARRARGAAPALSGTIWPVFVDFLYGMTLAAAFKDASKEQQGEWISEMSAIRESLAVLAENCADNFRCPHLMLAAEINRVEGRDTDAMSLYEEAIDFATSRGGVWQRAWAAELYSRLWQSRGNQVVAMLYLTQAYRDYQSWGAEAKVADLERKHRKLAFSGLGAATASLDVSSLAKAARAVTQELEFESVVRSLMKIALENAGAERGFFLSSKSGQLVIEAEQVVGEERATVLESIPASTRPDLAHSIVQYVLRTGETVVLGNPRADERFSADPYIASKPTLSILCLPIVHHREAEGVLYLENRLSADVFSSERTRVLQMVAAQAAISLENARLYQLAKREADDRQQAEETLRSIVEGTARVTGADFFRSLVQHLAGALRVQYAFVAECNVHRTHAHMLAFWKGGDFGVNTEYDVAGTPCANVLQGEVSFCPRDVQHLFPDDKDLTELRAESYLGVPISSAGGSVIGHLAILALGPLDESPNRLSVLRTFSARAGAEMDRLRAEGELKAALAEVQKLKNQFEAENVYLQEEIRREHNFEEIVGSSPVLLDLLEQVERVAPTDATVLICGETGTGKELIARAIHDRSHRRERPLVKVNCGAISAGLVESELFGHVKGAFTGATERRTGRFELADGGTVFLDEVGELPLETQVKLLRVLQEQEFEPVGSSRTLRVNVRIIAATNRDLEKAVAEGRFRADLYYRLNVLPLTMPALRERGSDIPQLVSFFVSRSCRRFGKTIERVAEQTMQRLMSYSWPGNVRELQNVIERAVVLSQGPVLGLDQEFVPLRFPSDPVAAQPSPLPASSHLTTRGASTPEAKLALQEVERSHILSVLKQTSWVIEGSGGAATILGLHPNTLRSRLKKLGLRKADYEIS